MKFNLPFFRKKQEPAELPGLPVTSENLESPLTNPIPTQEVVAPVQAPTQPQSQPLAEEPKEEPLSVAVEAALLTTQEDIIGAYKIFLQRHPESMNVIKPRIGLPTDRVLLEFMSSSEFLARPNNSKMITELARKIQSFRDEKLKEAKSDS